MQHHVIDGRIYRVIELPAEDTREAAKHVSAQRPIGFTQAAEIRKAVAQ
jgi:hypothetical protein